jgi:hypothetical protein
MVRYMNYLTVIDFSIDHFGIMQGDNIKKMATLSSCSEVDNRT